MLHPRRPQLALAVATAAVALGVVGVLSSTGSAQSTGGPRTVHFVATEAGGFEEQGRFGNGSAFGFTERLKADDGSTGRDIAVCTITSLKRKEAFCHVAVVFPNGQLVFEFAHRESHKSETVAVVGGTGAYADARGSAVARSVGRTKTDITVSLVG
jgi:hypothetical protein